MNQPSTILNELRELSPALASIPRVNVFKVPDGYFETLPALLLLQTGREETSTLKIAVPEGYFDGLADNIMARIKNEAVADDRSAVLTGIGNKNIYTIPDGYFEGLSAAILSRIKNENNSVQAETNEISTLVAGIGNKNVYSIPQGYFDGLADTILQQTAPAKVVRMGTRRTILKYAAAAVVTGFIAMSAFFVFNKTDKPALTAENEAVIQKADAIIKTNSFDKELASVSDADIVNFLESKGQDVDAALVASLTEDDKALPEADDYLFNENTLDEVLKDLDLNN